MHKFDKDVNEPGYLDLSAVEKYSQGMGKCFVYNGVIKKSRAAKPFVTLHLRDYKGRVAPGYIFDLESPLLSGKELSGITGKIVVVEWEENYLNGIGLTLILKRVYGVDSVSTEDWARFCGEVPNRQALIDEIVDYFRVELNKNVTLPGLLQTHVSPEYERGRVGGLALYYAKICRILRDIGKAQEPTYSKKLASVFALYVMAHSSYTYAHENGSDDITLVTKLTRDVASLGEALGMGDEVLEIPQMFFNYEPKDVFVRTVQAVASFVKRVDAEMTLYETLPLTQEGDAGYGKIRRYSLKE